MVSKEWVKPWNLIYGKGLKSKENVTEFGKNDIIGI